MNNLVIAVKSKKRLSKKIANAVRELRTNLLSAVEKNSTILFTSTQSGEGKSTVSLYLALSLCHCGKKVVWMDCDFRKANHLFTIKGDNKVESEKQIFGGLTDILVGKCNLDNAIYHVEDEELEIIPRGNVDKMSCDLFERENFQELVNELRQRYDYIIMDCSAARDFVDSKILAKICDGVVYVIRYNKTNRGQIKRTVEEIVKCKGNIIGAVINKSKPY